MISAPIAAELAVDSGCILGEGILWCERRQVLWWTDIEGSCLWMHSPASGRTQTFPTPQRVGCLALCESGQLLLGLAQGLFVTDLKADGTGLTQLELLLEVEKNEPLTRINDGRCDRAGNFVFGTMNEASSREPLGSLYQYSRRGLRRLNLGGFAIPNSICFSPDGGTLYYCDSVEPRILCCDYDADTAATAHSRVFATLANRDSSADGSTIDAEGHLWNAEWGAARVVRYTPNGKIDRVVALPTIHPTCPAFGGPALDQLYVATARWRESPQGPTENHAGGVFRCATQIQGRPESRVVFL